MTKVRKKGLIINILSIASLLCGLFFTPEARGQNETPDSLLRSRIQDMQTKGAKGDAEALYHLSTLYERGYASVEPDSALSRRYLRLAAEGGYAPACNYLGYLIFSSHPEQRDSAIYWLDRAYKAGDMKAANNMAFILLSDSIPPETDTTRGIALLNEAAEAGVGSALDRLGDIYREGRFVEADTVRARDLYLKAISRKAPDAEKKLLSMMYDKYKLLSSLDALKEGIVMARAGAETTAFILFTRAAEDHLPRAHALLGDAYAAAKGTDYNNALALDNYFQGARGGDPSAQFVLAELLEIFPDILSSREEVTENPDYTSPHYWYTRAAMQGVSSAEEAAMNLFIFPE